MRERPGLGADQRRDPCCLVASRVVRVVHESHPYRSTEGRCQELQEMLGAEVDDTEEDLLLRSVERGLTNR
jgi:hypothetical protein